MGARIIEVLVGVAVLASAAILVAMLAVPFLAPSPDFAPTQTDTPAPSAAGPSVSAAAPPVGTYRLRGRFPLTGTCLGIELGPEAYPAAEGDVGVATVWWWNSSIVDPGNPAVCSTRVAELAETEATVSRTADEDDPDGPPLGYLIEFHIPVAENGEAPAEILVSPSAARPTCSRRST
jgi:hypothetical protein